MIRPVTALAATCRNLKHSARRNMDNSAHEIGTSNDQMPLVGINQETHGVSITRQHGEDGVFRTGSGGIRTTCDSLLRSGSKAQRAQKGRETIAGHDFTSTYQVTAPTRTQPPPSRAKN